MGTQAELTIRGFHVTGTSEKSQMETRVTAEYYQRDGSHYLFYREKLEGFEEPVKTRIRLREKRIELNRQGALNAQMIFEEGRTHLSHYMTPYGELLLGIATRKVELREGDGTLSVEAEYSLEMNGEHQADSRMEILLSISEALRRPFPEGCPRRA